jgi:predicted ATP-grasp superfamily ATP-dependent carboligase
MAIRVLVTDANSTKALAIVRSLGTVYEVFAAGTTKISLGAFSRYCRKYFRYKTGSKYFIGSVLDICRTHQIDVIITPEEESSFLAAQNRSLFTENGITITVPGFDVMQICMSKPRTLEHAARAGVPLPRTEFISSTEQAFEAAEKIGYPVVVRPVSSHYWTGERFLRTGAVGYMKNRQELEEKIKSLDPQVPLPFIQEYVESRGMSVLCATNKNAQIIAVAAHEGIREYRPTGGTLAVRRSIAVDDVLLGYCSRLIREIGYDGGVLEVEFIISKKTGDVYFVEINPRFWATVQGPINAGVDFPKILVASALGIDYPEPVHKTGVVTRWWLGDLIRFISILNGKPPGFQGDFPSRRKGFVDFFGRQPKGSINEVLRFNDIVPAIMEAPCMIAKYLGKQESS